MMLRGWISWSLWTNLTNWNRNSIRWRLMLLDFLCTHLTTLAHDKIVTRTPLKSGYNLACIHHLSHTSKP
jgi:hypothetical protein